MPNPFSALLLTLVRRLRFPYLFLLTAVLFVVDLFVPDAIPLVDELLLGGLTLLFGAWRRRKAERKDARVR